LNTNGVFKGYRTIYAGLADISIFPNNDGTLILSGSGTTNLEYFTGVAKVSAAGKGSTIYQTYEKVAPRTTDNQYGTNAPYLTAKDAQGNVYIYCIAAIYKFDANGNLVWQMPVSAQVTRNAMTVDNKGNIYFTGYFTGNPDFEPGQGVYHVQGYAGNNIFVERYGANGTFAGALSFNASGTSSLNAGTAIIADNAGNIYLAGQFNNTVDFDPSAGVHQLTAMGISSVYESSLGRTLYYNDVFVTKLNLCR
jgi:hypothetical protein